LTAWPPVNGDEGREMNAFWVHSGVDPSARTLDPVFEHDPLYKGGLQGLSTAISFRLFGLGLFQGRIVSLVWGGLLLWVTYLAGRRLYGPAAGGIAVLFLAVSHPFLVSSHIVRPDIVVATLVVFAVYCALRGLQEGGRDWHLLAGLMLGLSFDVHPNTLAFMPLVGLFYLARYGRRAFVAPEAWLFAGGIAIGALYYAAVRIAPDPAHFAEAFRYWIGVDKPPPLVAPRGPNPVEAELGRWTSYFSSRLVEFGVLAVGVAWAAARSLRERRLDPLLGGLLLALVVFTVLVSSKTEFYLILFFPLLVLLLAGATGEILSRLDGSRVVLAALIVLLAVAAMGFEDNFGDMSEAASTFAGRDYDALSRELREQIPAGSRVVAPPIFWIGLATPPYYLDYVDFFVWERVRRERDVSWPEFLRDIDPDYVILDSKTKYEASRSDDRYLEQNADLVAQFRHVNYTRVEVWKMRGRGQ
ncbi:MAG: glycosyltransferase family 39 protein, partial [Chloroflexota bacterium]|nr:glycosyltransferase family 39 protein [Chloroflexota bacterium]